jgi:predicted aspartyl protease
MCLQLATRDLEQWQEFLVANLGPKDMILGLSWLHKINLQVDWTKGTITMGIKGQALDNPPMQ